MEVAAGLNGEAPQPQTPEQPTNGQAGNGKRKYIIVGIVLAVVAGTFVYWLLGRCCVVTDDAQVAGHLVPINARVSGYVRRIDVDDNDPVKLGRLLVQLDRRDLEAKVRTAQADLATQRAQYAAASAQLGLTEKTAPAEANRAGSQVTSAEAGVAASGKQIQSAEAQARAAGAAVEAAAGAVSQAKSDVSSASAQIDSASANVRQSQSRVTAAEAEAKRAKDDAKRFKQLYEAGAIAEQQYETAETTSTSAQANLQVARDAVDAAKAALSQAKSRHAAAGATLDQANARLSASKDAAAQARAAVGIARAGQGQAVGQFGQAVAARSAAQTVPEQIGASSAQRRAALARIKQAEANLRNAQLQLSYTRIVAPIGGVVSQKTVQMGQYVQPGQMLMSIVPLNDVWVVANFKETQMTDMHAGQEALVTVDAYPGVELHGKIQSIGAASGAKFSLLPPENATGNFVKVVQRIPVKIVFDHPLPKGVVLRVGQNVVARVYL